MIPNRFLCLLLIGLLTQVTASAQLTIYGGPQITSADYKIREIDQPTEQKQGFMAGVGLKSMIEGPAYFAPQLYYSQKGYKVTFNQRAFPPDSGAMNNNVTVHAIEFAPLVQFNFSKNNNYLYLRFGPAFDFNIAGHEQYDSIGTNKRIDKDMVFSFGDYSYATISAIGHLGFQHKSGFTIFAHYAYGLSSLNNADYGPQIFHRVAGVAIGWKLGKKP